MDLEPYLAWKTNRASKPYEDRYLLPLGDLPNRLETATSVAQEGQIERRIERIRERGLVFAVVDGVGGAPKGMAAAQATVDGLRELYTREALAPHEAFPSAREVLALLYEANAVVHGWGFIDGTAERPLGAACATVAYLSPAGNLTIFQAGDTCAFVYRARGDRIDVITGAEDVAGRAVRRYIGLGPALDIEVFPVGGLESSDLIALVSDGVYPKGYSAAHQVHELVRELEGDPSALAEQLVQRSRNRGSRDDITALVLGVG